MIWITFSAAPWRIWVFTLNPPFPNSVINGYHAHKITWKTKYCDEIPLKIISRSEITRRNILNRRDPTIWNLDGHLLMNLRRKSLKMNNATMTNSVWIPVINYQLVEFRNTSNMGPLSQEVKDIYLSLIGGLSSVPSTSDIMFNFHHRY